MKDEIIKSVSEAFSMQPTTFEVTCLSNYESACKHNPEYSKTCIKSINLELFQIGSQSESCDFENVYVGRNFDGNVIFRSIAKCCNVMYFI